MMSELFKICFQKHMANFIFNEQALTYVCDAQ